jgi:hypothetical protein
MQLFGLLQLVPNHLVEHQQRCLTCTRLTSSNHWHNQLNLAVCCCCCCCRSAARRIKRKTAEQYENGFAADPEDCIESDTDSATIAVSAPATPAPALAPAPMPLMHAGYPTAGSYPQEYNHRDVHPTAYAHGYSTDGSSNAVVTSPLAAATAAADAAAARNQGGVMGIGRSTSAGAGGVGSSMQYQPAATVGSSMQYQPAADGRRVSMF